MELPAQALCASSPAAFLWATTLPSACSLLLLLEKGKENFRATAVPKALWLPESLVFTFQNLKNSDGIHTALHPPDPRRLASTEMLMTMAGRRKKSLFPRNSG